MSLAIRAWFRMARLFAAFRIPAFAGMTGEKSGMTARQSSASHSSLFLA